MQSVFFKKLIEYCMYLALAVFIIFFCIEKIIDNDYLIFEIRKNKTKALSLLSKKNISENCMTISQRFIGSYHDAYRALIMNELTTKYHEHTEDAAVLLINDCSYGLFLKQSALRYSLRSKLAQKIGLIN
jgi:hypothetical protein